MTHGGLNVLGPRLVVAGTSSGVGKTTVATGLMAALAARGLRVAPAKVGPDFIDPGYHALATGRPGRNLDAWMCGEDSIVPAAARAGAGADVLVVEGVMGLFDGASDGLGARAAASTAHVAKLLDAPVLLVVDASSMAGSVAAVVHGYSTLDPDVDIAGVILNRVGSKGHAELLSEAIAPLGVPVLGVLHRDDGFEWRDRHLGLVPVVERTGEVSRSLNRLASAVTEGVDLAAVMVLARSAPTIQTQPPPEPIRVNGPLVRVAVAAGPAFSFTYRDNLEALETAGAEIIPFDPMEDSVLPAGAEGLVVGGGFPEVYAVHLAGNRSLLVDVAKRVGDGLVTWAECGGLLWLSKSLDNHTLAGVIPAHGRMTDRLTLGYRTATIRTANPLASAGTELRGHEFHYSTLEPGGDAMDLKGRFGFGMAGYATPTLLASYLHLHLLARPEVATRFVATAGQRSMD